jgi:hypothetical protein
MQREKYSGEIWRLGWKDRTRQQATQWLRLLEMAM